MEAGEIVAPVGGLGCGKTTLLRLVSGLLVANPRRHRRQASGNVGGLLVVTPGLLRLRQIKKWHEFINTCVLKYNICLC